MSISAAYMRRAAQMGLTLEQAAELAEIIEAGFAQPVPVYASSGAALRQKRYRDKKNGVTESVTRDVTQDVTRDVTDPVTVTPPHVRGENNLSRLVDTGLGVGVVGARDPDQQTDDWPAGNAKHHAELIVQTVACHLLDPQRAPTLVTTTGRIAAWKRAGASWEHDVLPVIQAACQGRRERVNGWQYFDKAIARSIADNRQALEIPEAVPRPAGRDPPRPSFADQLGDERRRATEMTLKALSVANG